MLSEATIRIVGDRQFVRPAIEDRLLGDAYDTETLTIFRFDVTYCLVGHNFRLILLAGNPSGALVVGDLDVGLVSSLFVQHCRCVEIEADKARLEDQLCLVPWTVT